MCNRTTEEIAHEKESLLPNETPKIPDTHRILCSSSEKSFPGWAAATLGLITRALFRLQTPSSDEKYVSC